MANVKDIYSDDEKKLMLQAVRKLKGASASVAKMANSVGLNPNRARFVLEVLIETGKVEKIPVKAFNKHYIRYTYKEVK